jgi:hypothetical protein
VITELAKPRRLGRALSIAAAVTLIVAGGVALSSHQTERPAAAFTPPGEEYPLTEVPLSQLPAYNSTNLAKQGTAYLATAPGLSGWLVSYESPRFNQFTGTVQLYRCSGFIHPTGGLSEGCSPQVATIDFGPDDSGGPHSHVSWSSVPPGTALVGYADGGGKSWWQRPIGHLAFFPRSGDLGQMTAYADDGTVLQVADQIAQEKSLTDVYGPFPIAPDIVSINPEQRTQLVLMSRDLTRSCLNAAGATYPYGQMFPVLPAGSDPSTWDDCVAATKAAVDKQFAEWGGHPVPQHVKGSASNEPTPDTTA